MNEQIGWVQLHRKILDSRVFKNEGLLKVWIYCLCRANHEDTYVSIRTGRGETEVMVNSGQFIFGRNAGAKTLNMKPSTLWKRMLKLQSMENVNIQSNSHYSIITVCNWETYQSTGKEKGQAKGQARNNQVTGKGQPRNTDNNDNNDNNVNNNKTNTPTRTRGEVSSSGYQDQQVPLPETVDEVIDIGAMKGVPPDACKIYYEMRGRDNFLRNTKQGWMPILNWHKDLSFLYKKGALNKDTGQTNSSNNFTGRRKTKGDRHADALMGLLGSRPKTIDTEGILSDIDDIFSDDENQNP